MNRFITYAPLGALTLVAALLATGAQAQSTQRNKRVVVEQQAVNMPDSAAAPAADASAGSAFQALGSWVTQVTVVDPAQATVTVAQLRFVALQPVAGQAAAPFEPAPVIVGVPDLPLLGDSDTRNWSAALNYQGLNAQLLVLNAKGNRREARSLAGGLRAGERFKVRVTATYNSLVSIDQVLGDAWSASRVGQAYPQPGPSGAGAIAVQAGQTIDLPLGPTEYFVMPKSPQERFVLSVRHAGATAATRSTQPAYRQDSKTASSYLQLVPAGTFPAIEQVVGQPAAAQ